MKIRIGNDIRLNLTLKGPKNYDSTNIKSLKCYFINTSLCDFCNPCCGELRGCGCGRPCYHVEPCNMCNCHKPCGHLKYPYTPADPAFGQGPLRPNYGHCFHGCCCHKDFDNYCRYGFMDHRAKCHPHGCGFCHCCDKCAEFTPYFRPGHCDMIHTHFEENFRYLAASRILEGKNKIQTYFPAQDQLICGDYKLVVVLVVYEAGWGRCDLHTYTIDYGTVFTLVDDDSAINGDVTIDVDNDRLLNGDINDLTMPETNYFMYPNKEMALGGVDAYGKKYNVEVEFGNGTIVNYHPQDWPYTELKFEIVSGDSSVLQLAKDGTIYSNQPVHDTQVGIKVTPKGKEAPSTTFTVTVLGASADYIGFSNIRPTEGIIDRTDQGFEDLYPGYTGDQQEYRREPGVAANVDLDDLNEVSVIEGLHRGLKTTKNGQYLWIASRAKVQTVLVDGMAMPLTQCGEYDGHFYCACPNPVMSNVEFDVTVKI